MTQMWTKQLCKDADLKFYVQAGAPFWPRSMLEPLTVVVVFPLSCCQLQRTMDGRGRPHTEKVIEQLDLKFQRPRKGGRREFLDLEEPMSGLQDEDYRGAWHRIFCANFIMSKGGFPRCTAGSTTRITRTTHEEGGRRGKRVRCR